MEELLSKIVILRLSDAGLMGKAARKATAPLWKAWKLDNATQELLSDQHWCRAKREAEALRKPLPNYLIADPPFNGGGDVVGPPFYRVMIGQREVLAGQVKPGAMPVAE